MNLPTWYSAGIASVDGGSSTVTGTGALWGVGADDDNIMRGDLFSVPSQPLIPAVPVAAVTEDGELELLWPWPGADVVGQPYIIRYVGIMERSTAQTRRVLEQLGDVKSWADVFVRTDADRLALDTEGNPLRAGFRVLVVEDGLIWAKATGAYGDWLPPAEFQGPQGNPGPYTDISFGPLTTLPSNQPGYAEYEVIGPGEILINLFLPKGQDGTGTGDVVGPASSTDLRVAVWSGTSGKQLADSGKTLAEIMPGDSSITNGMLADMAPATVKGRAAGGTDGAPGDLTAVQLFAVLQAVGGVLHVQDRKVAALGGNFVQDAWRVRDLNTVLVNSIPGASLNAANGQITLPAGKYVVSGGAPAYSVQRHRARIFNMTTGLNILTGRNAYASQPGSMQSDSILTGEFQLSAPSVVRIEHYCELTNAAGFGISDVFGDVNIYTDITIARVPV